MPSLPSVARTWIEAETGSPVVSTTELEGATTAWVHRLDLADGRQVVSKRFDRILSAATRQTYLHPDG